MLAKEKQAGEPDENNDNQPDNIVARPTFHNAAENNNNPMLDDDANSDKNEDENDEHVNEHKNENKNGDTLDDEDHDAGNNSQQLQNDDKNTGVHDDDDQSTGVYNDLENTESNQGPPTDDETPAPDNHERNSNSDDKESCQEPPDAGEIEIGSDEEYEEAPPSHAGRCRRRVIHPDQVTPSICHTYGLQSQTARRRQKQQNAREYGEALLMHRERESEHKEALLIHYAMKQYLLKAGIKKFPEKGPSAVIDEFKQLHDKDSFIPKQAKNLMETERREALKAHMIFKREARWEQ